MASIAGIFDLCQCRSSCLSSLATRVAACSNIRQVEPAPEQTNMNTRRQTSGETALSHFRKTQTAIVLGEFFQELFIDIAQKEISSGPTATWKFRKVFEECSWLSIQQYAGWHMCVGHISPSGIRPLRKDFSVAALSSKCAVFEHWRVQPSSQGIRDVYAIYSSAKTKRVLVSAYVCVYIGACTYI